MLTIQQYYIQKFSEVLNLDKSDEIIIDLEKGINNNTIDILETDIYSPKFKKQYIITGRKILSNITYTPNSEMVRNNILSKSWPAENIAKMTHEDLYPDFYSALKLKIMAKYIVSKPEEPKDGLIKCIKCKSMKTVYTQAQTRSADEPMTTFVTCLNCDNHFKFS